MKLKTLIVSLLLAASVQAQNVNVVSDAIARGDRLITLDSAEIYHEKIPWNLRGKSIKIVGVDAKVRFDFKVPTPVMIDATGVRYLSIEGLQIYLGSNSQLPKVGLLLARVPSNHSVGGVRIADTKWISKSQLANIYVIAAEGIIFDHCWFGGVQSDTYTLYVSRNDDLGLGNTGVDDGTFGVGSTMTLLQSIGTTWSHYGTQPKSIGIGTGVRDAMFWGGSASQRKGGAYITIVGNNNGRFRFQNVEHENAGNVWMHVLGSLEDTTIRDSLMQSDIAIKVDGQFRDSAMTGCTGYKRGLVWLNPVEGTVVGEGGS